MYNSDSPPAVFNPRPISSNPSIIRLRRVSTSRSQICNLWPALRLESASILSHPAIPSRNEGSTNELDARRAERVRLSRGGGNFALAGRPTDGNPWAFFGAIQRNCYSLVKERPPSPRRGEGGGEGRNVPRRCTLFRRSTSQVDRFASQAPPAGPHLSPHLTSPRWGEEPSAESYRRRLKKSAKIPQFTAIFDDFANPRPGRGLAFESCVNSRSPAPAVRSRRGRLRRP